MASIIDYNRVRKRPNNLGTIQTRNTNPENNKKTHIPIQSKDNGRMAILEPRLLHHPHQPIPVYTSNPPIRSSTPSHTTHTHTHTALHIPDGTTICSIENRRLDKLHDIYTHEITNPTFEESLAKLIQRHNTQHNLKKIQI